MIDFNNLWGTADWLILVLYFVLVLGVGVVMHRRASRNFKSFFVASRRLTIPVLVGVAAAGWYESWSIVGLAECGWTMGISIVFAFLIPSGILRLPLAVWIGPYTRDKIPDYVVTLPDLIEYFYDKKTKIIGAVVPIFTILYSAALLFAVGDVLHMVSGIPIYLLIAIAGIVVIIYTAMAGLWALAVTDIIQFVVMTVSAGIVVIGILTHFGGSEPIWDSIRAVDPVLLTPMGHNSIMGMLGWVLAAASLYANAQSYQRFGAAKGGAEIKIAYSIMLIVGTGYCALNVFTGMTASIMFPDAETISQGFWATVFTILPTGARGLFIAGLIAAVMSTTSADVLIAAAILAKDIIKDFFVPKLSDKGTINLTRGVIVLMGLFIIVGTYLWRDGIGSAWYYIGGFQTAVFFVPIVLGFFYKKKTANGGFIAVMCGVFGYAIWEFGLGCPFGMPSSLFTWLLVLIVFLVVCNLTYKNPERQIKQNNIQGN